jgi:hypothetical protein
MICLLANFDINNKHMYAHASNGEHLIFQFHGYWQMVLILEKQTSMYLPCFFFVHHALLSTMSQYRAVDKHFSQYLWTIIAPSNLNSASIVAISPQLMQNPVDFFVVCDAGLV